MVLVNRCSGTEPVLEDRDDGMFLSLSGETPWNLCTGAGLRVARKIGRGVLAAANIEEGCIARQIRERCIRRYLRCVRKLPRVPIGMTGVFERN